MRCTAHWIVTTALVVTTALLITTRHPAPAEVAPSKTVVFQVDGLTCTLCKHAVEKALGSVAGVEQSDVDPSTGLAVVTVQPDVPPDALAAAIQAAGYPVKLVAVR